MHHVTIILQSQLACTKKNFLSLVLLNLSTSAYPSEKHSTFFARVHNITEFGGNKNE